MISKNQLKYIRQLEQKKFRRREGLFVAEGTKVVGDLMERYHPHSLFATASWLAAHPKITTTDFEVFEISDDELRRLSFQQHPQQVLALFPLPARTETANKQASQEGTDRPLENGRPILTATGAQPDVCTSRLSLVLDGVQDPGNLGTIIRIADWFGIEDIYCSEDTADAWNPKVVQATMGSIARVNIVYTNLARLLDTLPAGFPVYGTFLDGDNIYSQELTGEGLIVMGNEGNGISDAVRNRISRRLLIPDFRNGDTADSLNVAIATAITCSEFRRRKMV